jgi:hypothetical protein
MKGKPPLKFCDVVMIVFAIVLAGVSAFFVYARPRNTTQVIIAGSDREWVFPLDAEETVAVPGPLGKTIVRIHDHQAWVESSPCDNQVCVAAGHLDGNGQWAACLPNNVMVRIEGPNENTPDSGSW